MLTFVRESAQRLLGITPEIFPVSARLALRAKRGEPPLWMPSRFEALERFVRDTLDEGNRFRLKLANPLGVGQALAHRYATIADERLLLLKEDVALLDDIERQLAVYREDLATGFELRMTAVEKVLVDMEARGHAYFEDTLRIGRVMDLLESGAGAEGVRGPRRRRCPAPDRTARDGADRLADRPGLPAVAGGHVAPGGTHPERMPPACWAHRTSAPFTPIGRG